MGPLRNRERHPRTLRGQHCRPEPVRVRERTRYAAGLPGIGRKNHLVRRAGLDCRSLRQTRRRAGAAPVDRSAGPRRQAGRGCCFRLRSSAGPSRPPIDIFDFKALLSALKQEPDPPIVAMCSFCQRLRRPGAGDDDWVSARDVLSARRHQPGPDQPWPVCRLRRRPVPGAVGRSRRPTPGPLVTGAGHPRAVACSSSSAPGCCAFLPRRRVRSWSFRGLSRCSQTCGPQGALRSRRGAPFPWCGADCVCSQPCFRISTRRPRGVRSRSPVSGS